MARVTVTLETIGAAVVAHYLETGHAVDARGIAERLECSAPTVRKRLRDPRSVPGCDYVSPDRTLRQRKRWMPALAALRAMVIEARQERDSARGATAACVRTMDEYHPGSDGRDFIAARERARAEGGA